MTTKFLLFVALARLLGVSSGEPIPIAPDAVLVERACTTTAPIYNQCGGLNYNGTTCCDVGNMCSSLNPYYFQCVPGTATSTVPATSSSSSSKVSTTSSSSSKSSSTSNPTKSSTISSTSTKSSTVSNTNVSSSTKISTTSSTLIRSSTTSSVSVTSAISGTIYTTTSAFTSNATHSQSAYPAATAAACGSWTLVDNVCCPSYCASVNTSESCAVTGLSAAACNCVTPPSADCKSGTMYPEVHSVGTSEPWHFSRSTHFGLTQGGACGYGLYGLCTKGSSTASWTDPMLGSTCTAFCTAYPILCQDPAGTTLRGNLAAPNGDYYTQFWNSLPGDLDNYLSCGECMEVIHTKADGTDYAIGETGYTPPIVLEILDSCPCNANSKWCCGPGADHCGEINFTYGCPLPAGSIHLDLSDIAMGRLQGNGSLTNGVIPTRYKRVPCPTPGNVYIWLRDNGGPYYFALTAVNTAGIGSVTKIEVQGSGTTTWTPLVHDPNYTEARPQERYGAWVIPQGAGPFNVPIAMRITSPTGEQLVNMQAIKSFTAPSTAPDQANYIDLGMQFTH